jgi:hypothetical protein
MAVAVDIVSGDYPAFEASALASAPASLLVTLEPYVGADLVTQIGALSSGDVDQLLAELVQAVRTLGIP